MIIEINTKTLGEFWDKLSPENYLSDEVCSFVYRGQANSIWPLKPSVYRDDSKLGKRFSEHVSKAGKPKNHVQVSNELFILKLFVKELDANGLRIPNDSTKLRNELSPQKTMEHYKTPLKWPSAELLPLIVLAQHHGISTRLLDWSRRSFVAAYFAGSNALEKGYHKEKNMRIAVWALDVKYFNLDTDIQLVKAAGDTSKYHAAQSAVHTIVKQRDSDNPLEVRTIENVINDNPKINLYKISVPAYCSVDLIELCRLYGVSASTMFPDYDGAAKAVKDLMNIAFGEKVKIDE